MENNWTNELLELENFFKSIELPASPVTLDKGVVIINCDIFVESHIATARTYNGNKNFLPFIERLRKLKEICKILSATQNKKKK